MAASGSRAREGRGSIVSTTDGKRDSLWATDPGLQSVLENESGRKIMSEVTAKRNIRRARLLFQASAQSQSPSKDFVSIVITELGIIWSKWKITLRGYTSGGAPVPLPQEEIMSFTDFKCNDSLLDEVRRVFGESTFDHIERIIYGSNDPLSCTPEALMIRICSLLDLQSIAQLSHVNRYLRGLCSSDKLWSLLYVQHQGNPTAEICVLANDMGWKKVFYMSKLQLQKELSRRRAQYAAKLSVNTPPPISSEKNTLSPAPASTTIPRGLAKSENARSTSENHPPVLPRASANSENDLPTHKVEEEATFLTEKA